METVIGWNISEKSGCYSMREIQLITKNRREKVLFELRNVRFIAASILHCEPSDLFELETDNETDEDLLIDPEEFEIIRKNHGKKSDS